MLAILVLGACEGSRGQVESTMATTTKVADALGVVVLYLCDQAEVRAIEDSDTRAEYDAAVLEIRQVCDPVGEAYDALAEAQFATLSAMHLVANCQAKGAACVAEVGQLAETAAHAVAAADAAREAAEGVVVALHGQSGATP